MTDADELADLVVGVARRLRRATHAALAPHGVSPHQSRALRIIGESGASRPGEIAARLHIAPRSATDVLDALAAGGWVDRSPDPVDRRAALVSLTAAGRELLERVAEVRRVEAERIFGVLDADAREALAALLLRVDLSDGEAGRNGQAAREG